MRICEALISKGCVGDQMTAFVTVKLIQLSADSKDSPPDATLLSGAEKQRLNSMSLDQGRVFALGRSLLRRSLADVLGMAPKDIPLVQQNTGPVILSAVPDQQKLAFSVSHSGNYIGVACQSLDPQQQAVRCKLGLDIEDTKGPKRNWQRISERYFNPSEQGYITDSSQPEFAFYQIWTAKEALVKMDHGALAHYLSGTEIYPLGADHAADFSTVKPTPAGTANAQIKSWQQGAVTAALAVDQPFTMTVK